MARSKGLDIIFIDYLQLMHNEQIQRGWSENTILEKITQGLKQLAKELQIPVVALSQLSRDLEKRGGKDKMPMLSDLRNSGAIEQDADVVMFIHRPEYYNENEPIETKYGSLDPAGKAIIKVAKNRNGTIGHDVLEFTKETSSFYNLTPVEQHIVETFPEIKPNIPFNERTVSEQKEVLTVPDEQNELPWD
jgi:replicative DNA helicase